MEIERLIESYKQLEKAYNESISSESPNLFGKILDHEIRGPMNNAKGIIQLYETGIKMKDFEKHIGILNTGLKNSLDLIPLNYIKSISKEDLTSKNATNVYNILEQDTKFAQKAYDVKINLNSRDKEVLTYIKPEIIRTLISTNLGDALKWSPKEEDIEITLDDSTEGFKLSIENKVADTIVNKNIGLNKGFGTKFNNSILYALNGKINSEVLEGHPYKTFLKEIYFPK